MLCNQNNLLNHKAVILRQDRLSATNQLLKSVRTIALYVFIIFYPSILLAEASSHDSWPIHGGGNWEQRFSRIAEIKTENVNQLGLAWTYDMGTYRGLQATPIMVDGTLYVSGTWGKVHALNAESGKEIWKFNPHVPGKWGRYGCCDVVNRGVAFAKGRVFVASFDGRLFALNAKTGVVQWEVDTVNNVAPYTSTGAPRIIKNMVLIGNAGADYGVRGFVTAYDAESGKQLWRFYTVPGDPKEPFEHPELEMAVKTWSGDRWWVMGGGGTVWDSMSYDSELNLVYIGVGNGAPWPQAIRSPGGGDNLFLTSIIALNPDSGQMSWYYQTTPGESLDFTATQNMVLATLPIKGKKRNVLMQAPKNGFFYVLDRATGQLISAKNYVTVNWASHIDIPTGRPIDQKVYGADPELTRPSPAGGHNWQPMAYNPKTGLVYIPARESGGLFALSRNWTEKGEIPFIKNWWNIGVDWNTYTELAETANPDLLNSDFGFLGAWDPLKSQYKWSYQHKNIVNGGVLTTAGDLVFQGAGDGIFRAHHAETGEVLWSKDLQTGMVAPPITYRINKEQYIAILAGWGGSAIASGNPQTSAAGKYENSGKLFVFKLGGNQRYSPLKKLKKLTSDPIQVAPDPDKITAGATLYMQYCSLCHGSRALSSGVLPDLRMMQNISPEVFRGIVLNGSREALGMPNFSDVLSPDDTTSIHSYILYRMRNDGSK